MADISKINVNETEYNLKDATARNTIQSSITVPKASVVTVTDAYPMNAEDITVDITPKQDLHGSARPWAWGAWKNKLPMTVEGIKAANTYGTWNGNTYTLNGVTFEILTDSASNVIRIKVNGTASASTNLVVWSKGGALSMVGIFILNGCPIGGTTNTFCLVLYNGSFVYDIGTGANISVAASDPTTTNVFIHLGSGTTANNLMFYPMARLATETDPTFAPYSNICPIEGWTSEMVDRCGKNWYVGSPSFDGYENRNSYSLSEETYNGHEVIYKSGAWGGAYKTLNLSKGTYTFSAMVKCSTTATVSIYDTISGESTQLKVATVGTSWQRVNAAFNVTEPRTAFLRINLQTNNATIYISEYQLELGAQPTTYEPYQGISRTVNFGETVYGGKWHSKGGTDKTHANIANYNGETINEPWLSSLDEYVAGATPTTGAQVVYPLTTPTTINTRAVDIPMLQGINTISGSTGDVTLKYQPDNVVGELKGEIRAVEAELAEAEEALEIVYEDHVANTSMGIIVDDGYSVGDMPFSTALDISKTGYIPIAVTDTSVVSSTVADQGEIATHCILDVANNRVRFYVHVMDSAASLTIPPNSLTFRVAYKKA